MPKPTQGISTSPGSVAQPLTPAVAAVAGSPPGPAPLAFFAAAAAAPPPGPRFFCSMGVV